MSEENEKEKMEYEQFQKRNISFAKENWKNANFWGKLWIIFLGVIVGGGIVASVIFYFMGLVVVMGVIIGCLLVFVPLVILGAYLVERQHLQKDKIDWNIPAKEAVVLSCVLHTEKADLKKVKNDKGEVEILSSTYKMRVKVEGEEKTVYDNQKHNVGDTINLRVHKNNKKIFIVE